VQLAAVLVGVMAAVMAPWIIYNLVRFERPVTFTSGTGMVLLHGSCDSAFYGDALGYYDLVCGNQLPSAHGPESSEDALDEIARAQAFDYITENTGQIPTVVLARAGRVWDVYQPYQNIEFNDLLEGRGTTPSTIGLWYYWALLPLGLVGAVVLKRRAIPISPLVGMFVAVTLTAMLTFGITRYRVPADVALVVLAALGIDSLVELGRRRFLGPRIVNSRAAPSTAPSG
jgi:hypothetical protein